VALAELWRRAREHRAQGRVDDALATLAALYRSGDETWAPLALLESARLRATLPDQRARARADVEQFPD